jgi:hypothetical protein
MINTKIISIYWYLWLRDEFPDPMALSFWFYMFIENHFNGSKHSAKLIYFFIKSLVLYLFFGKYF